MYEFMYVDCRRFFSLPSPLSPSPHRFLSRLRFSFHVAVTVLLCEPQKQKQKKPATQASAIRCDESLKLEMAILFPRALSYSSPALGNERERTLFLNVPAVANLPNGAVVKLNSCKHTDVSVSSILIILVVHYQVI